MVAGSVVDLSAAFGASFVVDLTRGDEIGVDEAGAFVMLLPKIDFCTAGVGAADELATAAIDAVTGFVIAYECAAGGVGC